MRDKPNITLMVEAAMIEVEKLRMPLLRSECEHLIRAALDANAVALVAQVQIPTETMQQEFQSHYRMGYAAGKNSVQPASIPELTATITAVSKTDKDRIVLALRTLATQMETNKLVWIGGGIHINGDAVRGPLYVRSDLKFDGPDSQEISVGPTPTN